MYWLLHRAIPFLYMKILTIIIILLSENNSLKYIDTISS